MSVSTKIMTKSGTKIETDDGKDKDCERCATEVAQAFCLCPDTGRHRQDAGATRVKVNR